MFKKTGILFICVLFLLSTIQVSRVIAPPVAIAIGAGAVASITLADVIPTSIALMLAAICGANGCAGSTAKTKPQVAVLPEPAKRAGSLCNPGIGVTYFPTACSVPVGAFSKATTVIPMNCKSSPKCPLPGECVKVGMSSSVGRYPVYQGSFASDINQALLPFSQAPFSGIQPNVPPEGGCIEISIQPCECVVGITFNPANQDNNVGSGDEGITFNPTKFIFGR